MREQFFMLYFRYTPQNEIKGNHSHIDDEGGNFENRPMPTECDDYKDRDYETYIG